MKSSIAAPCFRNSGLLTTLKGCEVSAAIAARTFGAVPTGTVLLSTTTVYLFIARPISLATPRTCCRSAAPSSPCGVPTAMNTMSDGADRGWQVGRERQALFVPVADDHLLEPRLVDGHLARLRSVLIFDSSLSTHATVFPFSARQAPRTSPT